MKTWMIAAVVAFMTATLAGTAQAETPKASVGIQGVGIGVTTVRDTAMYSGPGLSTPRIGTAWAGDNVGAACQLLDNNGKRLVLGIERPGRNGVQWANTAGYIWDDDIREVTSGLPFCTSGPLLWSVRDTAMYSGPGLSTPRIGTAWAGTSVIGICKILDNNSKRLVLGVQLDGRNGVQWARTAGYIWDLDIAQNTNGLVDCGLS